MSVSVAGMRVNAPGDLSPRAQSVIGLIDDGKDWLSWAISSTMVFPFPNEIDLVDAIQGGIHASPLVLLPGVGLLVGAKKLMTLSLEDLKVVAAAEAEMAKSGKLSSVVQLQLDNVLLSHQLRTQSNLEIVGKFLGEVGVSGAPLFQAMGIDEQLAIYRLALDSKGELAMMSALQTEAAAFGVARAATVPEFVDYYKSYFLAAHKSGQLEGTPQQRESAASSLVGQLLPCMWDALGSPEMKGLPLPSVLYAFLREWIAAGNPFGFSRPSSGIVQMLQFTSFNGGAKEAAQAAVAAYLKEAKVFILEHEPTGADLEQDGETALYTIKSQTHEVEIVLSGEIATLKRFRLNPEQRAANAEPAQAPQEEDPNETH